MARGMKFWILEVEELYYLCSENKGADQLSGYRAVDLHLCFPICKIRFSHDAAHIVSITLHFHILHVKVLKFLLSICNTFRKIASVGTILMLCERQK